jgi:drug/metabolite transporter (DMT)-like permease
VLWFKKNYINDQGDAMNNSSSKGGLFALLAAIFWGFNYVLVKTVLKSIPESQFLFIRFILTVVLFLIFLAIRREPLKLEKQHILPVFILGVVGVGFYNIIWTYGIHQVTAANAALLISTSPIFTSIYAAFRREEPVSFKRWVGTILAFVGIYLIVRWAPGAVFTFNSSAFTGNILILGAALIFALYSVMAKPLLNHYSPNKLTAYTMTSGLLVLIPYCLADGRTLKITSITLHTWLYLGYIIIVGTVVAYVFWYKGIQHAGPVKTILFHYLCPVISMAVEPFFSGVKVSREQLVGALLVLIGLLLVKGKIGFNLLTIISRKRLNMAPVKKK